MALAMRTPQADAIWLETLTLAEPGIPGAISTRLVQSTAWPPHPRTGPPIAVTAVFLESCPALASSCHELISLLPPIRRHDDPFSRREITAGSQSAVPHRNHIGRAPPTQPGRTESRWSFSGAPVRSARDRTRITLRWRINTIIIIFCFQIRRRQRRIQRRPASRVSRTA